MIRFTIPGVPPSLNKWSKLHWGTQKRIKKEWETWVYYAGYNFRPDKPYKKCTVRITYFFPVKRKRDIDNYTPKFILDGLKGIFFVDDSEEVIGQPIIEFKKGKTKKTVIEIDEG